MGFDKNKVFGRYQAHEDAKNNLMLKAGHKALDIPQDDMNITTTTNHVKSGVGPWAIIGAALAGGLIGPGIVMLGYLLSRGAPEQSKPADSAYDVRFYDKDGKLIEVPHISQKKE